MKHDGIVAPCVFDGPINGASFTAWVEQSLIPALEPGTIVVLDNLGSHKGSKVRRLLKAAGIRLFFLPPYSRFGPLLRLGAPFLSDDRGACRGGPEG